ncbi:hypothetical protein BDZ45DRAFT_360544 [Acephala macrosclerotiorum]|nr:hypothetical protein BDZ45DRAFT_360544 [Acephala macrosclerotiorum]
MDANYTPLGLRSADEPPLTALPRFGKTSKSPRPLKVIGETKEERSRIAREIRLAQKKAHKKEKADAKKARKLNGILHRRATKNPEKYTKNKERNRQRDIDAERQKIQYGAVRQCELLAAKHDPSGKLFNVGEVIVTPEGKIKSKAALQREAEREAEKKAKEEEPRNKKISKNQLKRQEMLKPKPVPPKPIIPEGIPLPEGEENLIALWDITDQEIESRLKAQKAAKKQAGKDLRKMQKEKKKLNKAMKERQKQCAYAGVIWDPERARREIIAQMTKDAEDESDSDSNSSEDDSDDGSQSDVEVEATKKLPKVKAPKLDLTLLAKAEELERQCAEKKAEAKRKRREERKAKAKEEARAAEEARLAEEAKRSEEARVAEEAKKAEKRAEDKRKRREERKAKAEEEARLLEEARKAEKSEKKRKRSKDDENEPEGGEKETSRKKRAKAEEPEPAASGVDEPVKKRKKSKIVEAEPTLTEDDDPVNRKEGSKTLEVGAITEEQEPVKKKRKSKTVEVEPIVTKEDEPVQKKKKAKPGKDAELALGPAVVEEDETKKEKNKKGLTETELVVEEVPSTVERKMKVKESNDEKLDRQIAEREAKMKAEEAARGGGAQWNADSLSGDAARRDKFLRLLGAGKNGTVAAQPDAKKIKEKGKDKKSVDDIAKVQSALERQYEAGMKLKHDGGNKRRGLGA